MEDAPVPSPHIIPVHLLPASGHEDALTSAVTFYFQGSQAFELHVTPSYTSYFPDLHTKQAPHTITALTFTVPPYH